MLRATSWPRHHERGDWASTFTTSCAGTADAMPLNCVRWAKRPERCGAPEVAIPIPFPGWSAFSSTRSDHGRKRPPPRALPGTGPGGAGIRRSRADGRRGERVSEQRLTRLFTYFPRPDTSQHTDRHALTGLRRSGVPYGQGIIRDGGSRGNHARIPARSRMARCLASDLA